MRTSPVATIEAEARVDTIGHLPRHAAEFYNRRVFLAVIICAVSLYVSLAVARSLTDSPGCDEGWFASPAFNLVSKGHMGTTVIEEANLKMTTGIHQYTYWVMPLHILAQAGWYEVFGSSLFSMRSLSILWGAVALLAWFFVAVKLGGDRRVALLALVFIALDFAFVRSAATGRMDMMCAALNAGAMAAYLVLRERNFRLAVLASHSLIVLSGLTHPNGLLGFLSLLFITLYFDRQQNKARGYSSRSRALPDGRGRLCPLRAPGPRALSYPAIE